MNVITSEFKLLDFAIINSSFSFLTFDENESRSFEEISQEYPIDIDYVIFQNDEDKIFRVFIKTHINIAEDQETQVLPGYSISAEGVALFDFMTELSKDDKIKYLNYSGVSIALNSLRSFISNLTGSAPFGRYILPSIDLNNLVLQKAQQKEQVEKNEN